jgi:hypothetical protein
MVTQLIDRVKWDFDSPENLLHIADSSHLMFCIMIVHRLFMHSPTDDDHIIDDIRCERNISEDGDGEMDMVDIGCATSILIIDDVGCSRNIAHDSNVDIEMKKQDMMKAGLVFKGPVL